MASSVLYSVRCGSRKSDHTRCWHAELLWQRECANPPNKELRADLVCMHYYGMERHLFIDMAVAEPASPAMTGGARSSAEHAGVAADLRAQKKEAQIASIRVGRRACV